ncbi:MAG: diguanylate cyclase [Treponema sp.]|jgi:diguanylate cyclase (GGDEF)-like protein|nr:diguanylate cyclase [Treponema sp.]
MKNLERIYQMNPQAIDARKVEQRQFEKYMRLFLKNVPNVLLMIDKDLRTKYCSAQFLAFAGFGSLEELRNEHILDVYRQFADQEFLNKAEQSIHNAAQFKKTIISEASLAWTSGKLCLYAISTSPLINENGAIVGFCIIFYDDVINAKQKAEETSLAQSGFLAKISREIRTPMNAVAGMSMLMRTDNLDGVQKRYFNDIKNMSQILLSLIDDILDFSKEEAGKVEPVHFNIRDLFDNIVSLFRFITRSKNISFKATLADDVPTILFGDETCIRQIMTNILNNAVIHTRQGGVKLSLFVENKELGVKVSDTGVGIRDEDIPQIFDRLETVDCMGNQGLAEAGLELATVKQLVNLMYGSIKVESVYGKGSTFTILLPFEDGDPDHVKLRTETSSYVTAKNRDAINVLVVDDVPMDLTITLAFLEKHNLKADIAMSGKDALQMAQKKRYDLVFMDHMMPEMDGLETIMRIRKLTEDAWFQKMPIIVLTNTVAKVKDLFFAAGANDFVSKPIERFRLNRVLAEWLPADKIVTDGDVRQDPSQEIISKLERIDGLDPEKGVSYTGGSIDTYLKVLRQFCWSFSERKKAVLSFLRQRDWKNYTIHIHSFKSVIATIGIQQLSDKAKKLEMLARKIINGEPTVQTVQADERICRVKTQAFLSSVSAFKKRLESILGASHQDNRKLISATALIETLDTLEEACLSYRTKQATEIAAELKSAAYSETVDRELDDISALVSSLDYKQAALRIERLLKKLFEHTPLPKSCILVIDDDGENHIILRDILSPEYKPVFAFTGKEAFAFIEREKPDVILLDIMLPEMNGFDILKRLKSKQETAVIPVIIITALNNFRYEEKGLELGAVDFITKPFKSAVVKARVKIQLRTLQHLRTLEKAGLVDELTGLSNRRCFNDRITMEWKRAERDQKPLSFCMIDVDKFKEYNDAYGHPQGDILLRAVANIFAQSARRASDMAARIGGEEFGVLLPDTSIKAAVEIAEQIRQNVQNLHIPTAEDKLTSITVSVGVSTITPSADLSYHDLLVQADHFLYRAKKAGRNSICFPAAEGLV